MSPDGRRLLIEKNETPIFGKICEIDLSLNMIDNNTFALIDKN